MEKSKWRRRQPRSADASSGGWKCERLSHGSKAKPEPEYCPEPHTDAHTQAGLEARIQGAPRERCPRTLALTSLQHTTGEGLEGRAPDLPRGSVGGDNHCDPCSPPPLHSLSAWTLPGRCSAARWHPAVLRTFVQSRGIRGEQGPHPICPWLVPHPPESQGCCSSLGPVTKDIGAVACMSLPQGHSTATPGNK